MKWFGERAGLAAMLVLSATVVALGVLQYRWNREASDATGVRLADALQLSMINWHLDLFRNLSEVCLTIRMTSEFSPDASASQLTERLAEWRSIARYPELVAGVYVVVSRVAEDAAERPQDSPETFELNQQTGRFMRVERPPLGSIPADLASAAAATSTWEGAPPSRQLTESFYNIGSALQNWRFDPEVPALIRPIDPLERRRGPSGPERQWLVIRLDDTVLRERIFPDLAHRYFQGTNGLDYEVAVVGGDDLEPIYASDSGFGDSEVLDADGRMDLFGRSWDATSSPLAVEVFHRTSENTGPTAAVGVNWFPLLRPTPPEEDWQLIVRHRRGGPLGAFVTDMRRRGLAMSFGALCLMVLSMSMLIIASVRAQRLARLQMDFVTTVSHELRTPLTIIGSAADNIANGVVEGRPQLQEYGSVIGNEVARLSGLVERVLLFASTRDAHPRRYVKQSLDPSEMIDTVLASTEALVQAAQFTVERDTPPGLPRVTGDLMAASQCLENLITNALKYGKSERWIGIAARVVDHPKGRQVQISVADRGMGISDEDLPHIFEPFYRSPSVRVAQIHGTGLGLALAKQVAESMGGSLTVTSALGRGSTFTLTLRCAVHSAVQGAVHGAVHKGADASA